ncbi:MAG: LuxR C-terminal-related transcriptional regulator [Oscillospiraceae bacterium]|nr:LuxR C-terminal-related transcriptional regulator [Oscillospiraceae bacterium]
MDFLTAQEMAKKWGITPRQVQRLIAGGRIPGAKRLGHSWIIPADSEKPLDPRKARKTAVPLYPEFSILPALYLHGGSLTAAVDRCKSEEERTLLEANLAHLRGEPEEVRRLATPLCGEATPPQLRLGSELMRGIAALWLGDALAWKEVMQELTALTVPPFMQREKEFVIAALNAGLHGQNVYPKWLEIGAFTGLSPALFPAARWVYTSILYTKWKEVDLLAVAEPMIAECRREQSDLCEIYLRLIAAAACHDHEQVARAQEHIDEAAALAQPLGLIAPFVEYRHILFSVMDPRLKEKYPEMLSIIKKKMPLFLDHWTRVYNGIWEKPMADELTPREFEACMLAVRGMQINEIANRMGISRNSVKKYLNTAYDKLSVEKRHQLSWFIHP